MRRGLSIIFMTVGFFLLTGCVAIKQKDQVFSLCMFDEAKQKSRSLELSKIVAEDQKDREIDWSNSESLRKVELRDEQRRKRVAEIFAEGCFATAQDFANAALVYQHGVVPEHYFQAFLWAKRAMDLGDVSQRGLMQMAIDRYLVGIGHKQLYGRQAHAIDESSSPCYCLHQIEPTFTDKERTRGGGGGIVRQYAWLEKLNTGKNCPNTQCAKPLKPTPKGTIPGFW